MRARATRRPARRSRPRGSFARRTAPNVWSPTARVALTTALVILVGLAALLLYQRDHQIHTQRRLDEERFLRQLDQQTLDQERRWGVLATK